MKCLVSGASGFIGQQLCEQLIARGHEVVAVSRSGRPLPSGLPTQAVDLGKQDIDIDLLRGVDTVFHLAGIAHGRQREAEHQAVNHRATLRLARAADAVGVRSFIFLSSVKAMGSPRGAEVRTESDCREPVDAYGLSKWRAECDLRAEFAGAGMSIAIVRPALVFGAGVKGNLRALALAVRRGLPRPPKGGRRSMIALQDLVELLLKIALNPPAGVQTWIACGAESCTTRQIHDLLRAAFGKSPGIEWLPRGAWRLGAGLFDRAAGAVGESTFDKLFADELYDNAAVITATGWRPRIRIEDVVGEIAASARSAS